LAKSWLNKAENLTNSTSEWNKQFYPRNYIKGHLYWTKAKILAQMDNFKEAVINAEKVKNIVTTEFYDEENEEEGIDSSIDNWKSK